MTTLVKQSYSSTGNISVTVKDGVLTKVTLWDSRSTAKGTQRITAENFTLKA